MNPIAVGMSRNPAPFIPRRSLSLLLAAPLALLLAVLFPAASAQGQTPLASQNPSAKAGLVPSRVTQAVDETQLTLLSGNTHPLARPAFDRGAAPPALPMERMLLVLKRSPEQEAALLKLLKEQQDKFSPNYHTWLAPEEFGQQFGPSDQDVQTVALWLVSHGFRVNQVAKGRTVIEFSGTHAQVQEAFHTAIHRFVVNGEEHWANATDPEIPVALTPVVRGLVTLHNFRRKPMVHHVGAFSRSMATGEVTPLFTGSNGQFFAVGPTDFATIYNVLPLWNAVPAIDGTGQSIAIVGDSNINIQDVRDFRNLFGLPAKDPSVILNGPDPGLIPGDEGEADLDVELAGAVAKDATINLVVSESTVASQGVDLSAVYIIDNNIAPVMSESFGDCEANLGAAENQFLSALWQQAAAEGITVILSSGDNGSAGCDLNTATAATHGLAVSGLASTPFNVAVGGTDFDDAGNQSQFWNTTNAPLTRASAKSYIPELTWNDSCAQNGLNGCANPSGFVAGSGGPSSLYAKPSWQTGPGVPADGKRDVPDVSLFASDGPQSKSFYVMCEADALPPGASPSCNPVGGSFSFLGVGGTSASAPAFAGIMALVNHKLATASNPMPRQGNANFVFYKLAAQAGKSCDSSNPATITNTACIFYDITRGNISVPCSGGSPNCSKTTAGGSGVLVDPSNVSLTAWTTTAGYDRATGLGSINAANLANNWSSVSFSPSTTTLTLNGGNPVNITHGASVTVSGDVTSASGTPTGAVSLVSDATGVAVGTGGFTLTNGSFSGSTNLLPGGTYNVHAHYPGDGNFAASNSSPSVSVTVSKEPSQAKLSIVTFDPTTGAITNTNATTFAYGSPYVLHVDVTNSSGTNCFTQTIQYGCPTGTVTLTDNNSPLDGGTFTLNSLGHVEDQPIQLPAGSHALGAAYAGDNSYNASTSATDNVTVKKATTTSTVSASPTTVGIGANVTLTATINTQSNAVANTQQEPTGTVQFLDNGVNVGAPAAVTGGVDSQGFAQGTATLTTSFSTKGTHTITAQYGGDNNYSASTAPATTVNVLLASTTTVISSSPVVQQSVNVTFTAQVTPSNPTPTGTVQFAVDGVNMGAPVTLSNGQAQFSTNSLSVGTHTITATYSGDANYASSSGSVSQTVNPRLDFTLASNPTTNTVNAGASATYTISATAQNGFASAINLTCSVQPPAGVVPPAPPTCALNPTSVTPGVNPASSTLTVGTTSRVLLPPPPVLRINPRIVTPLIILALALLAALLFAARSKRQRLAVAVPLATLFLVLILQAAGCGGGGSSQPAPKGTTAGTYAVTVTGTSGNITHATTVSLTVN